MANSDKDILITPNKNTGNLPEINFVGQVNNPIKLTVTDDNTLSFTGSQGQVFSVDSNLTSGTIFAASDISGVPSIAVDASGRVDIARYNGSLNIGPNNNTTDRVLGVTGEIMITNPIGSSTPGAICFSEGGVISGTPAAKLLWDGPNYGDNNNYFSVWTNGGDRLTVTYGGGVGISGNNPRTRFHLFGTHNDTQLRLTLPAGSNGAGNGDINMQLWVSEPGLTWECGGIGMNVSNYQTYTYPSASVETSNSYMPRLNSNIGQAFIRFFPQETHRGGSAITFSTTDNNNTQYRDQIEIKKGSLGVGGWNANYKLNVGGDINFTGELYQNGQAFETLPEQTAQTDGSVLRTRWDGSKYVAYWTHDLDANYRLENPDQYPFRYIINRGYTVAGYKNAAPWRNGNRTSHPSDVTISLGDIIDRTAAYIGGSHNGVNLFVYNCANSWLPNDATTCSFSMITETNRGQNSSWNDTRARRYSGAWQDFLGNQWRTNGGRNRAYITSGNGNTSRHDLNTESMLSEVGGNLNHVSHAEGEYYAWVSSGQHRFTFSNEGYSAWSSYSPAPGNDGFNKHLATRIGFFYCSEAGNTNRNVTKRRDNDAVILRSGLSKPENGGEENMHTGMNKGYSISNYNGAQNNNAWIYFYYQDAIRFADGTLTYRKGIPGASSGTGQEGGDMMGAGVTPRTYMTYSGNTFKSAPGTITYGNTIYGDYAGEGLADASGSTGGIGSY